MSKRFKYDLGHRSQFVGKIGMFNTISMIPVVAGDSLQLDVNGVCRLGQLRRELVMDARVDIMVTYLPYRRSDPDFENRVLEGADSDEEVFANIADNYSGDEPLDILCQNLKTSIVKRPYWDLYSRTYNRYVKHPDDEGIDENTLPTNPDYRRYGLPTVRLEHPAVDNRFVDTNASPEGVDFDLDSSDWILTMPSTTQLDVRRLAQQQARLKTETQKHWFANYYTELMSDQFNVNLGPDTEDTDKPTLLHTETMYMSGREINGTAEGNHGSVVGKIVSGINTSMDRIFLEEHGLVGIFMVVRFDTVGESEIHRFQSPLALTVKDVLGHPETFMNEPPINFDLDAYFAGSGQGVSGVEPYGQWYRYHPSRIHSQFPALNGYPFIPFGAFNRYHEPDDYDDIFVTQALEHYNVTAMVNCTKYSVVPPATTSIYAGTR
jgi:hypothetical protein